MSTCIASRLRHSGLALILVVGTLTVLLLIAMAFYQNIQLEFKATVSARDRDQADVAAQAGIHQVMAFLQHDVWGVSETQAFACAEADGQLHEENGSPFDPLQVLPRPDGSVAFYISTPAGFKRITRPESRWRRPIVRVPLQISSQVQDHPTPQIPTADGDTSVRAVETDLSWVVNDSESYKQQGAPADLSLVTNTGSNSHPPTERIPVLCGAPLHDEFLPGPFDNHDLWKMRTHYNRVFSPSFSFTVGRGLNADAHAQAGNWIDGGWLNNYWAWPPMRKPAEFDYIDTRLCGDAIFHLFRSDLVASEETGNSAFLSFESGVDPQALSRAGIGQYDASSTLRYLHDKSSASEIHPANQQRRMIATHLGKAGAGFYTDTRGGAININQVNNQSTWEQYRNPAGKPVFYNDAKWIYIYTPEGTHGSNLMRYAITILSETGLPNANFTGPPPADDWPVTMEDAAHNWGLPHYLRALDTGFDAHGSPVDEKHLKTFLGNTPAIDWAEQTSARLYRYVRGSGDGKIRGNGQINSRAELSLFLRKAAFDFAPSSPSSDATANYIAHQLSLHNYENLRDHHWESERLILDRMPPLLPTSSPTMSTEYSSSIVNENDLNAVASVLSRRCLADRLDALRFTLGPDDTRECQPTPYQFNAQNDDPTRLQSLGSKALSISHLISASLDSPHLGTWSDANAPAWWQFQDDTHPTQQSLYLQLQDRKPDVAAALHTQTMNLTLNVKPTQIPYQEEQGYIGTHSWATRISEVGKILPRKYTEFPADTAPDAHFALPTNLGNNAWKFDGLKEYAFVELVANFSATDTPVRQQLMDDFAGNWKRHWKLLVMNPAGSNPNQCDVLQLASTRVLCIDLAADPTLASNFGGDALSADPRHEKTGLNRLKVFNPALMLSAGGSSVMAKTMSIPSVASWNGWTYHWRADMTKPLTLREMPGEDNGSHRSVEWQDSFARTHPSSYMLVLFDPKELPKNTVGQQLRWCCQRLGSTTDTLVLDAVDLPIDSTPFVDGWEAIDPRNNRDGRISWRKSRPYLDADDPQVYLPRSGAIPHDPFTVFQSAGKRQGPFKKFTGSPAFRFLTQGEGDYANWCDGLNENAIGHFLSGGEKNFDITHQSFGRYDIEDHAGARSWAFACANESASTLDTYGSSRGFLQFSSDLGKVPLHWMSFTLSATGTGASIPDPDLRHWKDLFRVTSLEQSITTGYLGGYAYGQPLDPDMYWIYPAMDGLDNDLDGRIDRLTSISLSSKDPAGHYQSDRKSIGRMNLNEISNPAAFWFAGQEARLDANGHYLPQNLMTTLGRKPHKGYVSSLDILTRLNVEHDGVTPYDSLIWLENSYVDLAAAHAQARDQYEHAAEQRMALARATTVSHSTVYTLCCTGQAIDRLGKVKAQSRIKVTVERTPEGKMNILEWAPLGD